MRQCRRILDIEVVREQLLLFVHRHSLKLIPKEFEPKERQSSDKLKVRLSLVRDLDSSAAATVALETVAHVILVVCREQFVVGRILLACARVLEFRPRATATLAPRWQNQVAQVSVFHKYLHDYPEFRSCTL